MNQEITKKCSKCQEVKPVTDFSKRKERKSGYRSWCKNCDKQQNRNWNSNNPEKSAEYAKDWSVKNPKRRKEINKKYRIVNKETVKTSYRKWASNNIDYQKNRRLKNPEYFKKYEKNRYKNDINYKIIKNYRSRISHALRNNQKSGHTIELLGCTITELWKHLEKKFSDGMTKNNYGKWHIDHIIPCSIFNMEDPVEQKQCFHYTNLQPLWAIDNIRKRDNIISQCNHNPDSLPEDITLHVH